MPSGTRPARCRPAAQRPVVEQAWTAPIADTLPPRAEQAYMAVPPALWGQGRMALPQVLPPVAPTQRSEAACHTPYKIAFHRYCLGRRPDSASGVSPYRVAGSQLAVAGG